MRIVMYSYGARGDIQPQVALAVDLRELGHEVRVCALENLRSFVEKAGVEYFPLPGDSQAILESEQGQRWLSSGNARAFFKAMAEISLEISPAAYRAALEASADADAIVGGTLCEDLAVTIAEVRDLPVCQIHTWPNEPTRAFPNPLVTRAALPFGFLNLATYRLAARLTWGMLEPTLNPFRAGLGLAPWSGTVLARSRETGIPVFQMWSEQVLAQPNDLPSNVATTGYIRLPASIRARLGEDAPPAHLADWISCGQPPVYLGFGSMPVLDPAALTRMVLEVARELKIRVVVAAGWTDLGSVQGQAGGDACFIQGADHGWVFPQCVAAVHHGGAGTTAASLEAGIPALICSIFADQPFWGKRLKQLGVGVHVPFAKLNRKSLAAGLRAVMREDVRNRAAALGLKLCQEDGNRTAVKALTDWLASRSIGHSGNLQGSGIDHLSVHKTTCRQPNRQANSFHDGDSHFTPTLLMGEAHHDPQQ